MCDMCGSFIHTSSANFAHDKRSLDNTSKSFKTLQWPPENGRMMICSQKKMMVEFHRITEAKWRIIKTDISSVENILSLP